MKVEGEPGELVVAGGLLHTLEELNGQVDEGEERGLLGGLGGGDGLAELGDEEGEGRLRGEVDLERGEEGVQPVQKRIATSRKGTQNY